ncbi:MAG: LLM class flavin-dependent oxidoreductase [Solirubrobacteraceae bacterium]|nr:LLM class flavin-dependent oxidoreductase [Solirubrobacteraceae bacterium]
MTVDLHWFLPTSGDSRSDLSLGNAVGERGSRVQTGGGVGPRADLRDLAPLGAGQDREPTIGYLGQIARSAEQLGFSGALLPTSTWCEDPWVVASALAAQTERFRFLIAIRPGLTSVTLAAQMAATLQRVSGGRLLLNVVTGGDDAEQRRFGDTLAKDARYARAAEALQVLRALWTGSRVTFHGEHVHVDGAQIADPPAWPEIHLGGSSPAALDVAARHADVYLTWGEPPAQVAEKLDRVRDRADAVGRELAYGIRLHAIARPTADEAWAVADRLLAGLDHDAIRRAQETQRASQSEGQRRMSDLHGGRTDALEVSPNLWAGVGLVRGGAGTALVGSYEDVADRIAEYHDLGIDRFILSGYPHLEEAYHVGEGVRAVIAARGLLAGTPPLVAA